MTTWVRQEDSNGCGIACLAMILEKTYTEVLAEFTYFDGTGLDNHIVDEYLADKGYAVSRKYKAAHWNQPRYSNNPRKDFLGEPFAQIHLVQARIGDRNHYVVMLRDGTVLDPITPKPQTIDGYEILNITGIAKL